jgi:hypothetical protein
MIYPGVLWFCIGSGLTLAVWLVAELSSPPRR